MTHHYSKPIRKKLRDLAGLAHERELSGALETIIIYHEGLKLYRQIR